MELGRPSRIRSVARLNLSVVETARVKHRVIEMTRAMRRRLERVVRKSSEKDYARCALAVLHLWETQCNVAEVAHRVDDAFGPGVPSMSASALLGMKVIT